MTRRIVRLAALASLAALAAGSAGAQEYGRIEDTQAEAPGYFYFARPGEPVVSVTAVGALRSSGLYFLGQGASLGDLLALSGGVTATAGAEDPTVRLYRDGGVAYEGPLRSVFGAGAAPPVLEEGDVVEVAGLVSTAPGFRVHTRPGVETVAVTAAGAFETPGQYVLEEGATVGDLVSLAGAVGGAVRDADERVTATVRVYRSTGVVYEALLTDIYARSTEPLQSGDVVDLEVVSRPTFTWRDALSIVTGVAAVVLAVDRAVGG